MILSDISAQQPVSGTEFESAGGIERPPMKIPFAKVSCAGNELKYLQEVLASGWLTTAGKALEFERRFAEAVGARHACAVNSCTAALHLALEALGVGPGDKVFVPTLTFTATAEVIRYLGADPVFLDVDYRTGLMTPEILEKALARHPEIKAVMVVHFGGQAAQMTGGPGSTQDGIVEICKRHGIRVIEDAAHAFPTRHNGRMVGGFGDITCFSFYANKTITTGEGGMLVTDDEAIYRRVKTMRLHGINRDIWDRFTAEKASWEYDVVAPGFKYNMPDINAAIGLAQLERAESMRADRQRCFEYYVKHLNGLDCVDLPRVNGNMDDHSCHLFWLVLKESAPVSRNRLIELLGEAGIGTSVHYKPLHRMTYYRERYQLSEMDFPYAEKHWRGCVSLPLYPGLREVELEYICGQVSRSLKKR
jgi:dTDP-4-amino-4,6-dideoxygalactose transaminase